jgi:diaminopimelate decarboxylase
MLPSIVTDIAGQNVLELAGEFGTPCYVYDAAMIAQRIADLKAFDAIRYAQKACSNLSVLALCRRHGVVVDAVSTGELHRARLAGCELAASEHPQVVYTADIFDRESLEAVVAERVAVNCGSPDMITQYGERCPGRSITLRINPGFGHGHSQKTNTGGQQSKHGIWHTQLAECRERAAAHDLTISGLHMHIGSGTDMQHLSQVCAAMEQACRVIGPSIRSISAGGGLPTPYRGTESPVDIGAYYELWNATRERLASDFGHSVSLEIEPGRYLVAESGYLLTEVRAVKQMGDNQFVLVDAGFNNLARPIMYGSYHPMALCPADGEGNRTTESVVVGGPLCESGDIFTQEEGGFVAHRDLPAAEVGDILIIGCAGAYGFVMSSNYNSKPLVAEVLIEDGAARLVRQRQTVDDIVRGEVVPA